jgi:hypothetical protein
MDFKTLLDRPIAFHRVFVTLTGSVTAALMLSQAVYWSKRTKDKDSWFYKTQDDWEEETGLSRSEQETARKKLNKYLHYERRGMPAQLYYRVDEDALFADLIAGFPQTGLQDSRNHDCENPADINRSQETTTEITPMGASAPTRPSPNPEERLAAFPADCQPGAKLMVSLFNLHLPEKPAPGQKGGAFAQWINGLRALNKIAAEYNTSLDVALKTTWKRWHNNPFTVAHPGALAKTMTGVLASKTQSNENPAPLQSALESALKNFTPRR